MKTRRGRTVKTGGSLLTRRQLIKYGLCGAASACLPSLAGCGGPGGGKDAPPKNIILITVDTLRADILGCYGYGKDTSPNIDAFAKKAGLYTRCLANSSNTWSSCAGILTGHYPHENRSMQTLSLNPGVDTLQEILGRRGYGTIGVVSNYRLSRKFGWSRGFDVFDDEMTDREKVRKHPERIAEHTTDRAVELMDRNRGVPLFLWVHYQDPHGPYTPPKPFDTMFLDAAERPAPLRMNPTFSGYGGIPSYQKLGANIDYHFYRSRHEGEIRYMDMHLGRLLEHIDRSGEPDESLVLFTADHGENLGEHNYFFTHGENLHNSLLHVPLMVKRGDRYGGTVPSLVQHIDILPTILDMTGIGSATDLPGGNLFQRADRRVFAEIESDLIKNERLFCLVEEDYKIVYHPRSGDYGLYDIAATFLEDRNVYGEGALKETADRLKAQLHATKDTDRLSGKTGGSYPSLGGKEKERLKALGYTR